MARDNSCLSLFTEESPNYGFNNFFFNNSTMEDQFCRVITFYLNGKKVTVTDAEPDMTLLAWLRSPGNLTLKYNLI